MRRTVIKIAAVLLVQGIASAHASDVNVGVTISGEVAPGVYGRVDIGNARPPLVFAQPVIITRPARPVAVAPIYLHVPPGHAKKWDKHCYKYNACSQPVYFVKSAEYDEPGKGHKKDHPGRGNGKGHGNGHGNGH